MHRRFLCLLALAPSLLFAATASAAPRELTLFAAASLQDAVRAIAPLWQARSGQALRVSFAASSALARQIEQGAPADVFLSADEPWMDYVAERGLILPETRSTALSNALVLIGAPDAAAVTLAPGTDLAALLGPRGRLATGDPAHVPIGRYAEAALRWMGQWDALAPRLARADSVRSALLLVERGEAPLGIVYETDALGRNDVKVLGRFPPASHPPVRYPFAVTTHGGAEARPLLAFLLGPEVAPVWRRLGFTLPE